VKLKSGEDWHPTEEMIEGWKSAYKKVDVEQELKKMSVWCEANPAKRKPRPDQIHSAINGSQQQKVRAVTQAMSVNTGHKMTRKDSQHPTV